MLKRQHSIFLPLLFLTVVGGSCYYFSRPTVVGYIGPFSGRDMSAGQDFFRGLHAAFQGDSLFNRFEIHSMDVNHSRRDAAENIKKFVEQGKISFLWTDFPKNREEDLSKSLQSFSGQSYSVSQFVPSEGEMAMTIGEFLKKDLKSSRLHIYYSAEYKKLLEIIKMNFRSGGDGIQVTESELEFYTNSAKLPMGVDTVLLLGRTKTGTQVLSSLKKTSFAGRTVILNADQYFDFSDGRQRWPDSLYAITIFDQEIVMRLKKYLPDMDISSSAYSGFSMGARISKERKDFSAAQKPAVLVSKY